MARPCKRCGKMIEFGTLAGKKIPLDVTAPCYELHGHNPDGTWRLAPARNARVSHFCTCPNASEFSGKGKEEQPNLFGE